MKIGAFESPKNNCQIVYNHKLSFTPKSSEPIVNGFHQKKTWKFRPQKYVSCDGERFGPSPGPWPWIGRRGRSKNSFSIGFRIEKPDLFEGLAPKKLFAPQWEDVLLFGVGREKMSSPSKIASSS